MRNFLLLFLIPILITFETGTSGCTKTVVQNLDSLGIANSMLLGKWTAHQYEQEHYINGMLVDKQLLVTGINSTLEYKKDGSYISFYQGVSSGNGSWQLVSPSKIVLDKGDAINERYYYILVLDKSNLITHGPFKSDGSLYGSFLWTLYDTR